MNSIKIKPLVSVVMPVYNAAPFLSIAIESILNQTFEAFEFVILNDGSTDGSAKIIKSFEDKRIRFINFDKNRGIEACLNYGFEISEGKYLARMDADDISMPQRLEKQVNFLNNHPQYAIVGTGHINFSGRRILGFREYFKNPEYLKIRTLFNTPIAHATIMFRRELSDQGSFKFEKGFKYAEDYRLFSKLIGQYPTTNLSELLYFYRLLKKTGNSNSTLYESLKSIHSILLEENKIPFSDDDLANHIILSTSSFGAGVTKAKLSEVGRWAEKLLSISKTREDIDSRILKNYIGILYVRLWIKSLPGSFSCFKFSLFNFSSLKFVISYLLSFFFKSIFYKFRYRSFL